ncbi:MAG: oxygenase MpaB family protein [Nocardioidaceae bacterium]
MTIADAPARAARTLAAPLAGPLRRQLARTLRSKVAGDEAEDRAREIWGAEGPRWFGSQDPVWRVHADASMFVGGLRALLLQSLHPLAMAGVAGHSGYRSDPWGRLQRTSHFLATTTFGTVDHAERAIAQVREIHLRVRGKAEDGRPYAASDPHLLDWVHLAEVDSFLRAYQLFGPAPLSPADADEYVRQSGGVAARLGATSPPTTVAELDRRLSDFRPELAASRACRDAARFLLLDPPLPIAARPGYGLLAAGAVASLPGWARRELRLPPPFVVWDWPSLRLGAVGAGVVRWAMGDTSVATERRQAGQPGNE